jgi:hypothetical protein
LLDWFNQIYADLIAHIDDGCIGGAFFEYSDEPYKADSLQQTMGVVNFSVATDSNGKRSDQVDSFVADAVTKKDIIYAAVQKGTFQGKDYNFNANVFDLLGRDPSKLSSSQCQQGQEEKVTSLATTHKIALASWLFIWIALFCTFL